MLNALYYLKFILYTFTLLYFKPKTNLCTFSYPCSGESLYNELLVFGPLSTFAIRR